MGTHEKIEAVNDWFKKNDYYRDKHFLHQEYLLYFIKLKKLSYRYFVKIVIEPSIGNPTVFKLINNYGKSLFEIHTYLNPFKHPKDELDKYQDIILEAYREEIEKDRYMCMDIDKNEYPVTPEECVSK